MSTPSTRDYQISDAVRKLNGAPVISYLGDTEYDYRVERAPSVLKGEAYKAFGTTDADYPGAYLVSQKNLGGDATHRNLYRVFLSAPSVAEQQGRHYFDVDYPYDDTAFPRITWAFRVRKAGASPPAYTPGVIGSACTLTGYTSGKFLLSSENPQPQDTVFDRITRVYQRLWSPIWVGSVTDEQTGIKILTYRMFVPQGTTAGKATVTLPTWYLTATGQSNAAALAEMGITTSNLLAAKCHNAVQPQTGAMSVLTGQIVDISTLPAAKVIPGTIDFPLPRVMTACELKEVWGRVLWPEGYPAEGQTRDYARDDHLGMKFKERPDNPIECRIVRTYHDGPPPAVTIQAFQPEGQVLAASRVFFIKNEDGESTNVSAQIRTFEIPRSLHAAYLSGTSFDGDTAGNGVTAAVTATAQTDWPATPFISDFKPSEWRLDVWVRDVIYVAAPGVSWVGWVP
jgi:hypothetical protein